MEQVETRDKMHAGLFVCAMKLVETRAIRVPIEALVAGTALKTSLALECSDRRILGVFLGIGKAILKALGKLVCYGSSGEQSEYN